MAAKISFMPQDFEYFMISQVGIWVRDGRVLILEDAANPGKWILPGGRIDKQEDPEAAFARELKEEINLDSFRKIRLLDMQVFYTGNQTPYCAVAYLIESDQKEIELSGEHLQAKWVNEDELINYSFLWDCTERFLRKGFTQTIA